MIGFGRAGFGGSASPAVWEVPSANTESVFYEGLGARVRNHEWYSAITKCCAVVVVCMALTAQHAGAAQFVAAALIMLVLRLLDCHYLAKAQLFERIYRDIVPARHAGGAFNLPALKTKDLRPKAFAFDRLYGAYYAVMAILATLVLVP